MTRLSYFLILTITVVLFSHGCIQVDTVVKVNADGSGEIEETFLMNKAFAQQMKAMMIGMTQGMKEMNSEDKEEETGEMPNSHDKNNTFDIFDESKLQERASVLGKDVTYLSGTRIVTAEYEGYKALYAFKDINAMKVDQNPGEQVPSSQLEPGQRTEGKKEYVTFTHKKGSTATLFIKLPAKSDAKASVDVPDESEPSFENDQQTGAMMAQMMKLFEGMRITFSVEVDGTILETNATHREGSRVTLIDVEYGKLIEMPEHFKKIGQAQPKTLQEARLFMKDIPGIKIEFNDEIRILFQGNN
jgi:hypothetical protein